MYPDELDDYLEKLEREGYFDREGADPPAQDAEDMEYEEWCASGHAVGDQPVEA